MKGSINYLKAVRDTCLEHKGDCKTCPLGDRPKLHDNPCPRLTTPGGWTDNTILWMVSRVGSE